MTLCGAWRVFLLTHSSREEKAHAQKETRFPLVLLGGSAAETAAQIERNRRLS